jgi:hypothetical protein
VWWWWFDEMIGLAKVDAQFISSSAARKPNPTHYRSKSYVTPTPSKGFEVEYPSDGTQPGTHTRKQEKLIAVQENKENEPLPLPMTVTLPITTTERRIPH